MSNQVKRLVLASFVLMAASGPVGLSQGRQGQGQDSPYLAAPTQVVAVRAGRLFDAKTGTMLSNQIVLIKGDRIADVGPSVPIPAGARVHRPERRDGAARHDRRARARRPEPPERVGRAPHDDHGSERAARSGRRLHDGRRHGLARRVRDRRAPQRDQQRLGAGAADAGRRAIAQPARVGAGAEHRAGVLQWVHRRQEHQRAVAGSRGRAGAEAARHRLGQDLHDPGFRRRRAARVPAGRLAGGDSVADARRESRRSSTSPTAWG